MFRVGIKSFSRVKLISGIFLSTLALVGLSRCSPIAPNLSKYNYVKGPVAAPTSPVANAPKNIHLFRYISRVVQSDGFVKSEKTQSHDPENQNKYQQITLSSFSEQTLKDQFELFKNYGKTRIKITPDLLPASVVATFEVDLFPFEKYDFLLEPSDLFLFSYYSQWMLEDFGGIVTELSPSALSDGLWNLEVVFDAKADRVHIVQEFLDKLVSISLKIDWKN